MSRANILELMRILIALLTCAFSLSPLSAETDTAEAEVLLVTPLSLINDGNLNFGRIVSSNAPGTVTVSPSNAVSSSGGATPISGTSNARFYGYGSYNGIVALWLSQNQIQIVRSGGSETMTVRNFTIGSTPPTTLSTNPRYFRIGAVSGFFSFTIGGTLDVSANQEPGSYIGTFNVTIEYY